MTNGFMKQQVPSRELAEVIGALPRPRTQVMKDIWAYIREHQLQAERDKRIIVADVKLHAVFGKAEVTMFEMSKILSGHLTPAPE